MFKDRSCECADCWAIFAESSYNSGEEPTEAPHENEQFPNFLVSKNTQVRSEWPLRNPTY